MSDQPKAIPGPLDKIEASIVQLAHAVLTLNRYSHRLTSVEEACKAILEPSPAMALALEAVAQVRASKSRVGKVVSVTVEWDAHWQFLVTIRGTEGYNVIDGFDLRGGTPGLEQLKVALLSLDVDPDGVDFSVPEECQPGALSRRLLFPLKKGE